MTGRQRLDPILRAALEAADPAAAVRRALALDGDTLRVGDSAVDLSAVRRVWLLGAGKASARMAAAAREALGGRVAGGSLTVPAGTAPVEGVETWTARHPIPDVHGLAGAADALQRAREAEADDLVLCLLSGGASALWPAPPEGVTLADLQAVTAALLRAGAPIAEINTVRKHLSRIAGGQLARAAAPARVLTLAVSDVVGAPLDVIGSGPTLPDPTTHADALEVLRRRAVPAPAGVLRHLQAGAAGAVPETPKPGELLNLLGFHAVLGVRDALDAAARAAEAAGLRARVVDDALQGEASSVAYDIVRAAREAAERGDLPLALLWGGETTVTVRGHGLGGRNQELALTAAIHLDGVPGITVAALATDGRDGPTDAAGAVVDAGTTQRARALGLNPTGFLRNNDAYHLLDATGDLLRPGPTGTNVNDIVVAVVG